MNRKISTPCFIKKNQITFSDFPRSTSLFSTSEQISGLPTVTVSSPQMQMQIQSNKPPLISALSAAIFCQNRPVYEKNGQEQLEVASLTKVMTFYCSLRIAAKYELDAKKVFIRVPKFAAYICGTSACLRNAEYILLQDLYYALMLPSGNDAACTLANFFGYLELRKPTSPSAFLDEQDTKELIKLYELDQEDKVVFQQQQGDVQLNMKNFVRLMNSEASRLQMRSTTYSNPHGLSDKGNKSSAMDYGRLCHFAMSQFNLFREIVKSPTYSCQVLLNKDYLQQKKASILATSTQNQKILNTTRKVAWENTNKLLSKSSYFIGIKTGFTPNAGPCLATHYQRGDIDLQVIVLKSKDSEKRWTDSQRLAEWMFAILNQEQQIQMINIQNTANTSIGEMIQKPRITSPTKMRKIKYSYNFDRDFFNEEEQSSKSFDPLLQKPKTISSIQPQNFQSRVQDTEFKRIQTPSTQSQRNLVIPLKALSYDMDKKYPFQRLNTCQEAPQIIEKKRPKSPNSSMIQIHRNKSAAPFRESQGKQVQLNLKNQSNSKNSSNNSNSTNCNSNEKLEDSINSNNKSEEYELKKSQEAKADDLHDQSNKFADQSYDEQENLDLTFRINDDNDFEEGYEDKILSQSFEEKMDLLLSQKKAIEEKVQSQRDTQVAPQIKVIHKPMTATIFKSKELNGANVNQQDANKLFSPRRKVIYAQKSTQNKQQTDSIPNKKEQIEEKQTPKRESLPSKSQFQNIYSGDYITQSEQKIQKQNKQSNNNREGLISTPFVHKKNSGLSHLQKKLPSIGVKQTAIFQKALFNKFPDNSQAIKSTNASLIKETS